MDRTSFETLLGARHWPVYADSAVVAAGPQVAGLRRLRSGLITPVADKRLIHWGGEVGPSTGAFVTQLLQRFRHPEHGYRSCLGLLGLAKRYGPARLEAACAIALGLGATYYRHVRDILANGRDLVASAPAAAPWVAPEHDNLRGAAYFH